MNLKNFQTKVESKTSYLKITVPENLDLALEGLIRKVLKEQPKTDDIYSFAANYFETLLRIRDKAGIKSLADQLCPFHNDEDAHEMIKMANNFSKPVQTFRLPKVAKENEQKNKKKVGKAIKTQKKSENAKEKRKKEDVRIADAQHTAVLSSDLASSTKPNKKTTGNAIDLVKLTPIANLGLLQPNETSSDEKKINEETQKLSEPEQVKMEEVKDNEHVLLEDDEEFLQSDPIKELVEQEIRSQSKAVISKKKYEPTSEASEKPQEPEEKNIVEESLHTLENQKEDEEKKTADELFGDELNEGADDKSTLTENSKNILEENISNQETNSSETSKTKVEETTARTTEEEILEESPGKVNEDKEAEKEYGEENSIKEPAERLTDTLIVEDNQTNAESREEEHSLSTDEIQVNKEAEVSEEKVAETVKTSEEVKEMVEETPTDTSEGGVEQTEETQQRKNSETDDKDVILDPSDEANKKSVESEDGEKTDDQSTIDKSEQSIIDQTQETEENATTTHKPSEEQAQELPDAAEKQNLEQTADETNGETNYNSEKVEETITESTDGTENILAADTKHEIADGKEPPEELKQANKITEEVRSVDDKETKSQGDTTEGEEKSVTKVEEPVTGDFGEAIETEQGSTEGKDEKNPEDTTEVKDKEKGSGTEADNQETVSVVKENEEKESVSEEKKEMSINGEEKVDYVTEIKEQRNGEQTEEKEKKFEAERKEKESSKELEEKENKESLAEPEQLTGDDKVGKVKTEAASETTTEQETEKNQIKETTELDREKQTDEDTKKQTEEDVEKQTEEDRSDQTLQPKTSEDSLAKSELENEGTAQDGVEIEVTEIQTKNVKEEPTMPQEVNEATAEELEPEKQRKIPVLSKQKTIDLEDATDELIQQKDGEESTAKPEEPEDTKNEQLIQQTDNGGELEQKSEMKRQQNIRTLSKQETVDIEDATQEQTIQQKDEEDTSKPEEVEVAQDEEKDSKRNSIVIKEPEITNQQKIMLSKQETIDLDDGTEQAILQKENENKENTVDEQVKEENNKGSMVGLKSEIDTQEINVVASKPETTGTELENEKNEQTNQQAANEKSAPQHESKVDKESTIEDIIEPETIKREDNLEKLKSDKYDDEELNKQEVHEEIQNTITTEVVSLNKPTTNEEKENSQATLGINVKETEDKQEISQDIDGTTTKNLEEANEQEDKKLTETKPITEEATDAKEELDGPKNSLEKIDSQDLGKNKDIGSEKTDADKHSEVTKQDKLDDVQNEEPKTLAYSLPEQEPINEGTEVNTTGEGNVEEKHSNTYVVKPEETAPNENGESIASNNLEVLKTDEQNSQEEKDVRDSQIGTEETTVSEENALSDIEKSMKDEHPNAQAENGSEEPAMNTNNQTILSETKEVKHDIQKDGIEEVKLVRQSAVEVESLINMENAQTSENIQETKSESEQTENNPVEEELCTAVDIHSIRKREADDNKVVNSNENKQSLEEVNTTADGQINAEVEKTNDTLKSIEEQIIVKTQTSDNNETNQLEDLFGTVVDSQNVVEVEKVDKVVDDQTEQPSHEKIRDESKENNSQPEHSQIELENVEEPKEEAIDDLKENKDHREIMETDNKIESKTEERVQTETTVETEAEKNIESTLEPPSEEATRDKTKENNHQAEVGVANNKDTEEELVEIKEVPREQSDRNTESSAEQPTVEATEDKIKENNDGTETDKGDIKEERTSEQTHKTKEVEADKVVSNELESPKNELRENSNQQEVENKMRSVEEPANQQTAKPDVQENDDQSKVEEIGETVEDIEKQSIQTKKEVCVDDNSLGSEIKQPNQETTEDRLKENNNQLEVEVNNKSVSPAEQVILETSASENKESNNESGIEVKEANSATQDGVEESIKINEEVKIKEDDSKVENQKEVQNQENQDITKDDIKESNSSITEVEDDKEAETGPTISENKQNNSQPEEKLCTVMDIQNVTEAKENVEVLEKPTEVVELLKATKTIDIAEKQSEIKAEEVEEADHEVESTPEQSIEKTNEVKVEVEVDKEESQEDKSGDITVNNKQTEIETEADNIAQSTVEQENVEAEVDEKIESTQGQPIQTEGEQENGDNKVEVTAKQSENINEEVKLETDEKIENQTEELLQMDDVEVESENTTEGQVEEDDDVMKPTKIKDVKLDNNVKTIERQAEHEHERTNDSTEENQQPEVELCGVVDSQAIQLIKIKEAEETIERTEELIQTKERTEVEADNIVENLTELPIQETTEERTEQIQEETDKTVENKQLSEDLSTMEHDQHEIQVETFDTAEKPIVIEQQIQDHTENSNTPFQRHLIPTINNLTTIKVETDNLERQSHITIAPEEGRQIKTIKTHFLQVPETVTKEYKLHHTTDDKFLTTFAGIGGAALTTYHVMPMILENERQTSTGLEGNDNPIGEVEAEKYELEGLEDITTPSSDISMNVSEMSMQTISESFLDSERRYSSIEKEETKYTTPININEEPHEVADIMTRTVLPGNIAAVPLEPRQDEEINAEANTESVKEKEEDKKPENESSEESESLKNDSSSSKNGGSTDNDMPFISVEVKTVIETQILDDEEEDRIENYPRAVLLTNDPANLEIGIETEIDYNEDKGDMDKPEIETGNNQNTEKSEPEQMNETSEGSKVGEEANERDTEIAKDSFSTENISQSDQGTSSVESDSTLSSAATKIKRIDSSKRNYTRSSTQNLLTTQSLDSVKRSPLLRTRSLSTFRQGVTDFEVWNAIEKELEEAATKIQSKFRGYRTRKKLQRGDAVQITTESSRSETPIEPESESKDQSQQSTGEFHDSIVLSIYPR